MTSLPGELPIQGLAAHPGSTLGCMLTPTRQRQEGHSLVGFAFINHLTKFTAILWESQVWTWPVLIVLASI